MERKNKSVPMCQHQHGQQDNRELMYFVIIAPLMNDVKGVLYNG